jgi:predicted outer membrane repeat protein
MGCCNKAGSNTFTINGGTISDNNAGGDGGGVNVDSTSTFTMNGGIISSNQAAVNGGGVHASTTLIGFFRGAQE